MDQLGPEEAGSMKLMAVVEVGKVAHPPRLHPVQLSQSDLQAMPYQME